jgi:hypothetical protein
MVQILENYLINICPSDIQFGFWFVGDDGRVHDPSHQHPDELHPRPGRSLSTNPTENDILHLRLLETLKNMAAERNRLRKRSNGGMKNSPKLPFLFTI